MSIENIDVLNGAGVVATLAILKEIVTFVLEWWRKHRTSSGVDSSTKIPATSPTEALFGRISVLEAKTDRLKSSRKRYRLSLAGVSMVMLVVVFAGRVQDKAIEWLERAGARPQSAKILDGEVKVSFEAEAAGPEGYLTPGNSEWGAEVTALAAPAQADGSLVVAYVTSFASRDGATREYNLTIAAKRGQMVVEKLEALGIPTASLNIGDLYREARARRNEKLVVIRLARVPAAKTPEDELAASDIGRLIRHGS